MKKHPTAFGRMIIAMSLLVALVSAAIAQTSSTTLAASLNYDSPPAVGKVKMFQDVPPAPTSPWSFAVYYDFRDRESSAVVLRRIGQITQPFHWKVNLDLDVFAGSNFSGQAISGTAVGLTYSVSKELDLKLSLASTINFAEPAMFKNVGLGVILGATYRFSSGTASSSSTQKIETISSIAAKKAA